MSDSNLVLADLHHTFVYNPALKSSLIHSFSEHQTLFGSPHRLPFKGRCVLWSVGQLGMGDPFTIVPGYLYCEPSQQDGCWHYSVTPVLRCDRIEIEQLLMEKKAPGEIIFW